MKVGGKDVTESTDVAIFLRNAFLSIGENIVKTIPSSLNDVSYHHKIAWNDHNLFFFPHGIYGSFESFVQSCVGRVSMIRCNFRRNFTLMLRCCTYSFFYKRVNGGENFSGSPENIKSYTALPKK